MRKMRIMLADDNALMRDALALFLESDAEIDVVAQVADGTEVLAQMDLARPDVICMDISMGVLDGIATTLQVCRLYPHAKVIGLSAYADISRILEMVQAGAVGYVYKGKAGAELLKAIRTVYQGQTYFNPDLGIK